MFNVVQETFKKVLRMFLESFKGLSNEAISCFKEDEEDFLMVFQVYFVLQNFIVACQQCYIYSYSMLTDILPILIQIYQYWYQYLY